MDIILSCFSFQYPHVQNSLYTIYSTCSYIDKEKKFLVNKQTSS